MNGQPEHENGSPHFPEHEQPADIIDLTTPPREPKRKVYARKARESIRRAAASLFTWQTLFTAVIAGAAILQFFVSRSQWHTANDALIETRRSLELAERPWVSADIAIASPLTFDAVNNTMRITLTFAMRNIGHSPAIEVSYYAAFLETVGADPVTERTKLCDRMSKGQLAPVFGDVIFPGDRPLERGMTIMMGHEAMARAAKDRFISPVIIACLAYRYSFSDQHRHTEYGFDLVRLDASKPGQRFAIEAFKSVPISTLDLQPWIYGAASYAN